VPTTLSTIDPHARPPIFASLLQTMKPGRLLDLACGHGVFSLVAARMGWQVTAVDVRTGRMPMTEGIRWVESDVREFKISPGDYDCIAILGLLYHLELDDQLDLMRRCSFAPTIVDTIVSLDPNVEERGYRGEYFDEVAGRTPEAFAKSPTASWKNTRSFWADEGSLIRLFNDAGFASVYKHLPVVVPERTFYLCLPPLGYDPYPEDALQQAAAAKAAPAAPAPVKRRALFRRRPR